MFEASDLARPEYKLADWDVFPDDEGEEEDERPDGSPSRSYRMKQLQAKKQQGKDAAAQGPTPHPFEPDLD
jgi:hypothetical protein